MAITTTVPDYTGNTPVIGQPQPEFNQNTADIFDYIGSVSTSINDVADEMNSTATQVSNDASSASSSAAYAANSANEASNILDSISSGVVNFAGDFVVGVTNAVSGSSYRYDGGYWSCLFDTTETPEYGNNDWRKIVGNDDVKSAEERAIGLGASIYRGSNGQYVQNGDIIPAGTTHLTVLIGGKVEDVAMSPIASGAVSLLTENSVNVGVISVSLVKNGYSISSIDKPTTPPHTSSTMIIMRPTGETGFYVVSKRARNRGGYIMRLVRNDVASADSSNLGGVSNSRLNVVNYCPHVFVAHSVAEEITANVSFLANSTYVDLVWRYLESGTNFSYFSESVDTSDNNLQNRKLYNVVSGTGTDYVEFRVSGDCTLHLGLSATSSESVEVQILDDSQATLYVHESLSLRKTVSSPGTSRIIDIKTPNNSPYTFYRVRVVNKSVNVNEPCYVAGLNIRQLSDIKYDTYITNAAALRSTSSPKYRTSTGANEFAAREVGGKFFGTFHGGHSDLFERLRVSNGNNYDIQADAVPALAVTDHVKLYTSSVLTPESAVGTYDYTSITEFADGLDITTYNISLKTGYPTIVSDMYTHMCTTATTFNFTYYPVFASSLDSVDNPQGEFQTCEQSDGTLSMFCAFSKVDVSRNSMGGLNIQKTGNFNKQYYGPVLNYPTALNSGEWVTIKEYS